MSEQSTNSDIRGTLMGDPCRSCRTSYGRCTDRLGTHGSCCKVCFEHDTHNERSVMEHQNLIEGQWALYADKNGVPADNEVAKAAFAAAWEKATVIARNTAIETIDS